MGPGAYVIQGTHFKENFFKKIENWILGLRACAREGLEI